MDHPPVDLCRAGPAGRLRFVVAELKDVCAQIRRAQQVRRRDGKGKDA